MLVRMCISMRVGVLHHRPAHIARMYALSVSRIPVRMPRLSLSVLPGLPTDVLVYTYGHSNLLDMHHHDHVLKCRR